MVPRPSSIIKLGGSLLGLPDLPTRLANLLSDFARPRPIVVAGGGAAVDLVRRWDRIYDLGEEASHWIALRLLSSTSRVVEKLLPTLTLVDSFDACAELWRQGRVPVYDPFHFIVDMDEVSPDPLPRRWRVTSDSIAARMAVLLSAEELILIKSVTPPERLSFTEASRLELVDAHFPVVARDIPRVAIVNLRAAEPVECFLYNSES